MRNYSSKEYFRDCTGTPFSAAYLLSAYLGTSICVRKALHGGIVHVVYVVVFDIQRIANLICPSGM